MVNNDDIFKAWVPSWLIKLIIGCMILPSMGLFGLSTASIAGGAGYYGIEPSDVQYSMIVFYAAVASFFALERRFFNFVAPKHYLLISSSLQILFSYLCYQTRDLHVLLPLRFLQGLANCSSTSICIALIFNRLGSERSRELGYSIFYCFLLCISPFTTLVTAPLLDSFDFNALYKADLFLLAPGTLFLYLILGNRRLVRKFPLYQADWASFVLYAVALCCLGYVLVYGQQYYWLEDGRIQIALAAGLLLLVFFVLRQFSLKRPYLHVEAFRYRNFKIGLLLIFLLYIVRGALSVTTGYFASALGMDPIHIGYLMLPNIGGIVIAATVAARALLVRRSLRVICLAGFALLLVFHVWMRFLFVSQADADSYILPMLVQGLGAGTLMAPLIIFTISSVPAQMGSTGSAIGVFFRFTGFCTSIALVNYFQLDGQRSHYDRLQQQSSSLDPIATQRMADYGKALVSRGMPADLASSAARGLGSNAGMLQAQLRYAMDYYTLVSVLLIAVLLIIAIYPSFNRTVINLRSRQPSPVSY